MSEYRADHVGSLLRPQEVLATQVPAAEHKQAVDAAIRHVIDLQNRAGLPIISDGEFRRSGFVGGFIDAVDGFDLGEIASIAWKGGSGKEPLAATNTRLVSQELTPKRRIAEEEALFLRDHANGPFKITLPHAGSFALYGWQENMSSAAYATRNALIYATGRILVAEATALAADGASYIQLDAPNYATWADPAQCAQWAIKGVDLDSIFAACMEADNRVIAAAKAAGATTGCHVCRGNNMGRWNAEGGYDPIAERLFGTLSVDRLLLEYDTANSGGFEPLRFVPRGTIVVLGLISTKTGALELRDDILRRVDEATRFISIDQLALSPQCGFASTAAGNPLTHDEQWRKLELVVSLADEIWSGAIGHSGAAARLS
jgi:5-methyltetrahydropteroyltriglutamate--homocysteine methyltransferase